MGRVHRADDLPPEPERTQLAHPTRDEIDVLTRLAPAVQAALDWRRVITEAQPWVQAVRDRPAPFWALESLLRVPDTKTAVALTADQLGHADFSDRRDAHYPVLAGLSAQADISTSRSTPRRAIGSNSRWTCSRRWLRVWPCSG